jgi:hypothetical protein
MLSANSAAYTLEVRNGIRCGSSFLGGLVQRTNRLTRESAVRRFEPMATDTGSAVRVEDDGMVVPS